MTTTAWLKARKYFTLSAEVCLMSGTSKIFGSKKSVKPDITLTDIHGNILAVIENKYEIGKEALAVMRHLRQEAERRIERIIAEVWGE